MSRSEYREYREYYECPNCGHLVTPEEYRLFNYDFECSSKKCGAYLSDYSLKLKWIN